VDGDFVYSLGAEGFLTCLAVADGKLLWELDLKMEYKVESPTCGFSDHPLVVGDLLIVKPGGDGTTAVALEKKTGKEVWRALSSMESDYAPPVLFNHGGKDQLITSNLQQAIYQVICTKAPARFHYHAAGGPGDMQSVARQHPFQELHQPQGRPGTCQNLHRPVWFPRGPGITSPNRVRPGCVPFPAAYHMEMHLPHLIPEAGHVQFVRLEKVRHELRHLPQQPQHLGITFRLQLVQVLHTAWHFRHDEQPWEAGVILQQHLTASFSPHKKRTGFEPGMQGEIIHILHALP
jgi:hypothetical protein